MPASLVTPGTNVDINLPTPRVVKKVVDDFRRARELVRLGDRGALGKIVEVFLSPGMRFVPGINSWIFQETEERELVIGMLQMPESTRYFSKDELESLIVSAVTQGSCLNMLRQIPGAVDNPNLSDMKESIKEAWTAVLEGVESGSELEGRCLVYDGNKKMINGDIEGAILAYKAAIASAGGSIMHVFGANFTLGNLYYNLCQSARNQAKDDEAKGYALQCKRALENFLRVAPSCHWHVAKASRMLASLQFTTMVSCGLIAITGAPPRHFETLVQYGEAGAREAIALLQRATEADRINARWRTLHQDDEPYEWCKTLRDGLLNAATKLGKDIGSFDDAAMHLCARCGKGNATAKCGGCKSVWYCDRDCQRIHWRTVHKHECKNLAAYQKATTVPQWVDTDAHVQKTSRVDPTNAVIPDPHSVFFSDPDFFGDDLPPKRNDDTPLYVILSPVHHDDATLEAIRKDLATKRATAKKNNKKKKKAASFVKKKTISGDFSVFLEPLKYPTTEN